MLKITNEQNELLRALQVLKFFCYNKPKCAGCPLHGDHCCVLRERPAANLPIIGIAHKMEEMEANNNG